MCKDHTKILDTVKIRVGEKNVNFFFWTTTELQLINSHTTVPVCTLPMQKLGKRGEIGGGGRGWVGKIGVGWVGV